MSLWLLEPFQEGSHGKTWQLGIHRLVLIAINAFIVKKVNK